MDSSDNIAGGQQKRWSNRRVIATGSALGLGAVAALAAIATSGTSNTAPGAPYSKPLTVIDAPTAEPQPTGPLTVFGPGVYRVGEDIQSGTYKTPGPQLDDRNDMCFWSRDKDASGELSAVIANGIVRGPSVVTVKTGEVFATSECQDWRLVD